jgi:hypothetical protein
VSRFRDGEYSAGSRKGYIMARKDVSDAQVLQAYEDEAGGWARIELLMERTGQPEKVVWRAMERACDRGYIEYGVSLKAGWLTESGKALLVSVAVAPPGVTE